MPQLLSMNLVHLFNSMDGTLGVDGCGAPVGLFRIARRSPRALPWAAMWLPPLGDASPHVWRKSRLARVVRNAG